MLYYDGIYSWENIIKYPANSELVFCYYLGYTYNLGKVFNSPLRKDANPSFAIFEGNNGLMFKDFATGESGDCIKFVQLMFNISRNKAITKILVDLFLSNLRHSTTKNISNYHSNRKVPRNVSIGLKTRDMDDIDISFWKQFYITKGTLDKYKVVSCSHVWINDNLIWKRTDKEPIFAYLIDDHIKIYRPYSERKSKWGGNTNENNLFGYDQLPWLDDVLIITKSGKDVMVLSELGYNAISPNSETALITKDIADVLIKRFKTIYVLMDNDTTGKKAAKRYVDNYNFINIELPSKEKDISDYIKVHGIDKTSQLLTSLMQQ